MKSHLDKILRNTLFKNSLTLAAGTAGAQIITIISAPIITRIYGPEAFGILGVFSSIITIIVPISALTYPVAIVLPKEEKEALGLMRLSFLISVIISLFLLLIVIFFDDQLINLLNINEISNFLLLIPIVVIFASLMQIISQWCIRINEFSVNAKAAFYQSLITNLSKIGIGIIFPLAIVLVVLTTFSYAIRAIIMLTLLNKFKFKRSRSSNLNLLNLAKKYKDFPLFRAPESLITGVSHGLPTIMLTMFFGPVSAGFYSLGRNVLSLPTQMIANAVGDAFYPKVTQAFHDKKDISKIILRTTIIMFLISLVPFGVIILFGPTLFSIVFGPQWAFAGEYARWISLWSISNFANRPAIRALPVINAQKFHLFYTIFGLLIRFSLLSIGFYFFNDDLVSVALFSASGFILNLILISVTIFISKRRYLEFDTKKQQ